VNFNSFAGKRLWKALEFFGIYYVEKGAGTRYVTPGDPSTLAGGCLLLPIVPTAAAYFPARRARRVSPLAALREE